MNRLYLYQARGLVWACMALLGWVASAVEAVPTASSSTAAKPGGPVLADGVTGGSRANLLFEQRGRLGAYAATAPNSAAVPRPWDEPTCQLTLRNQGPVSATAPNDCCNVLPSSGFDQGTPCVDIDRATTGIFVDLEDNHRNAAAISESWVASGASSDSLNPGTLAGVPLPSAAILFPLCFGTAVVAARRMHPRRTNDRQRTFRSALPLR